MGRVEFWLKQKKPVSCSAFPSFDVSLGKDAAQKMTSKGTSRIRWIKSMQQNSCCNFVPCDEECCERRGKQNCVIRVCNRPRLNDLASLFVAVVPGVDRVPRPTPASIIVAAVVLVVAVPAAASLFVSGVSVPCRVAPPLSWILDPVPESRDCRSRHQWRLASLLP